MRRVVTEGRCWGGVLGLLLACSSEADGGRTVSHVGDEVERDGWVDTAHALVGDGATSFESFPRAAQTKPASIPWQPFFYDRGADAGPLTSLAGDHLLSFSRFRGLVSTRVTGPDAPRVEATLRLTGIAVGSFLIDGVAAVLVVDPLDPGCLTGDSAGDCSAEQMSRVVLVDVQAPASPRALAEQRFEGTISAARQVAGVLHVLTTEIESCVNCGQAPSTDFTWLSFDRSAPRELPLPRVTPVSGSAFFGEERLFVLSPAATYGEGTPEFRVAELAEPDPTLSAPVALGGRVGPVFASGDRLRVTYAGDALDIETFALEAGTAVSLGRGSVALPENDFFGRSAFEGDRAVAFLAPSGRLAVFDLSDVNAPRMVSLLDVQLEESDLTLAGDRVLAVGRSRLPVDAPPDDDIARGPQGLALVDIANPAAPRVMDRVTLGSFDSVQAGVLELRGDRALFSYYEEFPTVLYRGKPEDGSCGRSNLRLVGYDVSAGTLAPAFAFEGLDADARIERLSDEWWAASSVSVSRYLASAGAAPSPRMELTRSLERVRALSDGSVALLGVDFASNAPMLELAPALPLESTSTFPVSTALGLSRVGCDERRRWADPPLMQDGQLYAVRFHQPANGAESSAAATLHALDARIPPAEPSLSRALQLEPLAPGEDYLGVIQTERALLIARGRRDAEPTQPGYDPRSLFYIYDTEPTLYPQQSRRDTVEYEPGDGPQPDAKLSYDVVDVSDPAAPVLVSRLDIDPELATRGYSRYVHRVTRDTTWGFHVEGRGAGPAIVSGSILVGQHSEAVADRGQRFYLDRVDFSNPAAPVQLDPIEIPGSALDFDAATGGLITLEALRFREPANSAGCQNDLQRIERLGSTCLVQRRALSGLVVDGDRATRVGRLLLDTDERKVVRFAVTNGIVYYATQSSGRASDRAGPFAAREVTVERVVLRDGRFERLPSFDIAGASNVPPEHWEQFAARGDRVLVVASSRLIALDFAGSEPRLDIHDLGPWGCAALDLRGDVAYCAQGQAGYAKVTLGQP